MVYYTNFFHGQYLHIGKKTFTYHKNLTFNKYFKTEFELFKFYVQFSGFTGLDIDKWKKKLQLLPKNSTHCNWNIG